MKPLGMSFASIVLILAGACEPGRGNDDGNAPVPLVVRVADHRGLPVGGARVTLDGDMAGITGEDGVAGFVLSRPDGSKAGIALGCPDDLIPAGDPREEVTVRRLSPVTPAVRGPAAIELDFTCVPALREQLLVIRADGRGGLPVIVDGEVGAKTGDSGTAHLVISQAPGEEIEVVLDTSAREELRPRSPARRLSIPAESRIILFDQRFEERRTRAPRKRRAAARPRRL